MTYSHLRLLSTPRGYTHPQSPLCADSAGVTAAIELERTSKKC